MSPLSTDSSIFCFWNSKYFLPATLLLGQSSKIPLIESRLSHESLEGAVFWVDILGSLVAWMLSWQPTVLTRDQLWHDVVAPPEEAMEVGRRLGKGVVKRHREGRGVPGGGRANPWVQLALTKSVVLADKFAICRHQHQGAQQSRWTGTPEQKALRWRNIQVWGFFRTNLTPREPTNILFTPKVMFQRKKESR